jgi:sigma-B regulation protein RsbU (phosphoserine phosphatase)
MDSSRFVTAVYGILDPSSGAFTYVNCGHNPPMLLRARGEHEQLPTGRGALGMFGNDPVEPQTVDLAPGDTLLLYTDGVVEATDATFTEFGEERLASGLVESAARPAREIIDRLVDATRTHAGREQYDDDFTLVVVKRDPV